MRKVQPNKISENWKSKRLWQAALQRKGFTDPGICYNGLGHRMRLH